MRHALLLSMMWLGCGRPDEGEPPPAPEQSPVLAQPAGEEAAIEDLRAVDLRVAPPGRPADRLAVTITNLAPEGRLRAVAGMMSCGFWGIGEGEAHIAGGQAELELTLEPGATGTGFSLFLFVDRDGDGKCTDDEVRSADLPALPASGAVQVDMKSLPQGFGGECWLFAGP